MSRSSGLSGRMILVPDSGLQDQSGHHRHFAAGLVRVVATHGWQVRMLAHCDAQDTVVTETGAVRAFRQSLYERIAIDRYDGAMDDYVTRSDAFARDLADKAPAGAALVLLPTATAAELDGLAQWLATLTERPPVAAIFHWGDGASWARGTLAAALLRRAAKALVTARPDALWFGATQPELAAALEPILGRRVQLVPSLTFFEADPVQPVVSGDAIRLIAPGPVRAEKGATLLEPLARALAAEQPPVRLAIQTGNNSELAARMRDMDTAQVLTGWIEGPTLASAIAGSDAALLPYDQTVYRAMVSGVFTLVAGLGRPLLVPAGTWMADRLDAGEAAGLTFPQTTVPAMVEAVHRFIEHRDTLQKHAFALAASWRTRYSADALVASLLAWAR